jgi:hypothetical protein
MELPNGRDERGKTLLLARASATANFFGAEICSDAPRCSAASTDPTAFSTATDNPARSRGKPRAIHPQFTLNPQLAHGLSSRPTHYM